MNVYKGGETVPLSAQLGDGSELLHPAAHVYLGAALEATVNLSHQALGRYEGPWTPLTTSDYHVVYAVYQDAGRTLEDLAYDRETELWRPVESLSGPVADAVLREALADHAGVSGSLAEAVDNLHQRITVARAAALDEIPGIAVDVVLIRKIMKNKLEMVEGSDDNWVLYDDDRVTPLIRWNVRDKDGQQVRIASFAPARRDPVFP